MSKIVITLDTETKDFDFTLDGQEMEVQSVSIYKCHEGFDFCAQLMPEKVGDVTKHNSLYAYASEFTTKSYASVKFLDKNSTLALVEEKKTSEKISDWIKNNSN